MTKEKFRNALPPIQGFIPVIAIKHNLSILIAHVLCRGLFILPLVIDRIHIPEPVFFFSNYKAPSELRTAFAVTGNAPLLTVGNAKTQTRRTGSAAGLINAQHRPQVVVSDHLYLVNQKIELDYET